MSQKSYVNLSQFSVELTLEEKEYREFSSSDADGTMFMRVYEIMPGVEIYYNDYHTRKHFKGKMDVGNFYQLAYSHEGIYQSKINTYQELRLSESELMLLSNVAYTHDACMPLGFYTGFNVMFYPECFSEETFSVFKHFSIDIYQIFNGLLNTKAIIVLACNEEISDILERLYHHSLEGSIPHMKLEMINLLLQMKNPGGFKEGRYKYLSPATLQTVKAVKTYIEKNMTRHTTIKELAEQFHISRTSLKDHFKAAYGYAPYEYLKRYRMHRAAELLRATSLTISEISEMTGYENASKFSSAFRSVFGLPPMAYKKIWLNRADAAK
ncbi:AraC family transcriptional regulator [Eubacterium sp. 1001713B170207_170306_E7]|uniref:helix-turn-helix domain-containing protein n=1 Tax=Eubacterium sp. 1001713B170207_170306_E7 TaxID=2787097 RepID=UPI00189713A7|nr:AraC family transcriptional regulator [Eubacterium sp. 1001713B170207_170306_E7]